MSLRVKAVHQQSMLTPGGSWVLVCNTPAGETHIPLDRDQAAEIIEALEQNQHPGGRRSQLLIRLVIEGDDLIEDARLWAAVLTRPPFTGSGSGSGSGSG